MAVLTEPAKTGFFTSEFFTSVGGMVASVLVAMGVVGVEQADAFAQLIVSAFTGVAAIFAIYKIVSEYRAGRQEIKMKIIETGYDPEDVTIVPNGTPVAE